MKKTEEKILKFIDEKKLIQKGDKILLGLSGGPDSVFLFHFLQKFGKRFKIELGAVHINHKLRGEDADKDELFCKRLCDKYYVPFFSVRKNVKALSARKKISLEEAGREVRYDVFEKTAEKEGYTIIATAHNCSDNAETVLLNLIKGTGIKGLAGIPAKRGNIIRPVLSVNKKEILQYLESKKLSYRTDSSNLDSDFERNFIRNELSPQIKAKLNPLFEEKLFNTAEIVRNILCMLEKIVSGAIENSVKFQKDNIKISVQGLRNFDESFYADIFKNAIENSLKISLKYKSLNELVNLVKQQTGSQILLPGGYIAVKERNEIIVCKINKEKPFNEIKLIIGETVKVNSRRLSVRVRNNYLISAENKDREYISADNLDEKFLIRRWKNGDRFHPLGLVGTKKVSDFLNEQKISFIGKKNQLVLTNRNKIVWVIGIRLDDRFKITKSTRRVVELCLK